MAYGLVSSVTSVVGGGYASVTVACTEEAHFKTESNVDGSVSITLTDSTITNTGTTAYNNIGSIAGGGTVLATVAYADATANVGTEIEEGDETEEDSITIYVKDSYVGGTVVAGGRAYVKAAYATATANVENDLDSDSDTAVSVSLTNVIATSTVNVGGKATASTGTDGTMSTVDVADTDQLDNTSIVIVGSASMLKDSDLTISENSYLTNAVATNGINVEFGEVQDGDTITVTNLTYFQNKADIDTANETSFTYALDNISANGGDVSDKIDFKVDMDNSDSAVMGLGLSYDFSETCIAYFDYNAYIYSNLITHSLNLSVALKF